MKEIGLLLLFLIVLVSLVFVVDCQLNGIGGFFCINDDGMIIDMVFNEVNGMDIYLNNGGYISFLFDWLGVDEVLEGLLLLMQ